MPPFRMVRPRRAWTPPKPKPPVYRGPKLLPGPPRGKRGRAATAAAAPSFNPLTGWTTDPVHGVWASDPLWTPPADGGAVSSWRNGGSVGGDLVQATGSKQPTYRASVAALNSKPTVQFDGADDAVSYNVTDIPQTYYLVLIASTSTPTSYDCAIGTSEVAGRGLHIGSPLGTSPDYRISFGTAVNGGTPTSDPALFVVTAAGASSALAVNGTTVLSGNMGTGALSRLTLGGWSTDGSTIADPLTGHIAYAAVFTTDPTALPEWDTFKAWCLSFYGVTVA